MLAINSSRAEQKSIKMAFIGTIFAFVEFVTQSVRPEIEKFGMHMCLLDLIPGFLVRFAGSKEMRS